jgi:GNAT superfamily N-acetyltransferase
MSDDITLRAMRGDDLAEADRVFRMAFGTWFGAPDPAKFRGDAALFEPRLWSYPDGGAVALSDGAMVGAVFASGWGSVGVLGPVAVLPALWRHGLARRLVGAALDIFARRQTPLVGLFTFPQSPLHLRLYQEFGFWPRGLCPIMAKAVPPGAAMPAGVVSLAASRERPSLIASCRALADAIHPGLDLTREIEAVLTLGLGDVLALAEGSRVEGFALCHSGAGSEGGSQQVYIKFAAVRGGDGARDRLVRLVGACDGFAASRGLARVSAGTSTGRHAAYRALLDLGFRMELPGVMMHRPHVAAYDRPDDHVIDDWR